MYLNDNSEIFKAQLSDFYFIYIGDENEEYSLINIFESQHTFNKVSIICPNPVIEGDEMPMSYEEWIISMKFEKKKFLLIFADLNKYMYFYELLKISNALGYERHKIIVIAVNDYNLIHGNLCDQYADFIKNHYVLGLGLYDNRQMLEGSLYFVLNKQGLNNTSTFQVFTNALEWEFLLKYYYDPFTKLKSQDNDLLNLSS